MTNQNDSNNQTTFEPAKIAQNVGYEKRIRWSSSMNCNFLFIWSSSSKSRKRLTEKIYTARAKVMYKQYFVMVVRYLQT
jgi:hypothetical protein